MKRHLSFALLTALLAVAVVPAASFAATTGSATPTLTVTADSTLTLALGSGLSAPSLTPTIWTSNATASYAPSDASAAYMTVRDYTAGESSKNGHYISFEFTNSTFGYRGSDTANYGDLTLTSGTGPVADQIYFKISSGFVTAATASYFSEGGNSACSNGIYATKATRSAQVPRAAGAEYDIIKNTETCVGKFVYGIPKMNIIGPSDGFGPGSYESAATITLWDDSDDAGI